jgi:phage tail protein X
MIELVCDGENEKNQAESEKNAMFKVPKNLRQVGNPPANRRIYIEDYVVTYLNYIARPGSAEVRGAVLVGEKRTTEQGEAIFISGAVDAQNIEFDMNECSFTEKVWSEIYEDIKEWFPDLSVMGWFLSRMGFSTAINERIEKLHIDNFPGSDKVLYVTDSLESEDAFYMYEKGEMLKQKGYYIYYTKNEQMQNYIISKRGEENTEEKNDVRRKDSELLKSYREKNRQLQEEKENNVGIGYMAGGFLALAVLAIGITVAGNYKKMQNMEVSINRLELTSDITETNTESVATIISSDALENTAEGVTASIKEETAITENGQSTGGDLTEAAMADADEVTEEEILNQETVADDASQEGDISVTLVGDKVMYKVKHGDTLTSIALAYYGSIAYIEDIAKANSIDENYIIYENENIVLPDVE